MFVEGGHRPPPNEPPRDYAAEDPPHRGVHPIRRGLAAAWVIVGLVAASPLIAISAAAFFWWRVLRWLTKT